MSAKDNPLSGQYKAWIACARKRPFLSRKSARDHAKGIQKRHGIPMEAYLCTHCGSWHLATDRKTQAKQTGYKIRRPRLVSA